MPKKISVDEIMSKRKDLQSGTASIVKAFKAPSSWNSEARTANFVMNAQAVDRYGDIVVTAGIDTTEFEKNPVALLFHNSRTWPVGTWSDLQKVLSGRPPRLEGKLNLLPEGGPVPEVDQCAWMIANGGIRGNSIGFIPDWDNYELILNEDEQWVGGIKFLKSVLIESSICAIPASPQSLIKNAESLSIAREFIEDILDNYTRTPEGLILPRSEYEAAHKQISGNPSSVVVDKSTDEPVSVIEARAIDETEGLPDETKQTLINRGMVFCTELKSKEKSSWGYVLAKSHEDAETIVSERASGEVVVGEFVGADKDVDVDTDGSAVIEKTASSITVDIETNVDQTLKDFDALSEKVSGVEKQVDGLFARISRFFGGGEKAVERVEPEITIEPEIKSPPTEDEIVAAKARAASIRERSIAKGLIAAE